VEDILSEEERERLANMSPEELDEELRKAGIDSEKTRLITERAIAEVNRREREKK
jgi:predicted HTH domain antitoxin